MLTTDHSSLLRGADLRVTRPRVAVLDALESHPHADTDTVAQLVRRQLGTVSTQAVYDVLRALTQAGLVRRIEPAGSPARFERRVGDNHHHVVCRLCGSLADVDCSVGYTPCLTASDARGFVIDEAEVTYWGTCPACTGRAVEEPAAAHNRPDVLTPDITEPVPTIPAPTPQGDALP